MIEWMPHRLERSEIAMKYFRPPFLYDLMFCLFVICMRVLVYEPSEWGVVSVLIWMPLMLIYMVAVSIFFHFIIKGIYWFYIQLAYSSIVEKPRTDRPFWRIGLYGFGLFHLLASYMLYARLRS